MKKTDVAYLAGLVDGEGYIGIKRSKAYACQQRKTPSYHVRIQVRMVDEGAIRFLSETLGGTYFLEKPHAHGGRPLYCFSASDLKAAHIIRTLLPYLRIKRAVAVVALSLRGLQAEAARHKTKVIGQRSFPNAYGTDRTIDIKCLSDEYISRCQALWDRCSALNHGLE